MIMKQTLGCYPLVNCYITMEHHHAINGKINELSMAMASIANCKRLPEGHFFGMVSKLTLVVASKVFLPSGKHTKNYGESPTSIGKPTN